MKWSKPAIATTVTIFMLVYQSLYGWVETAALLACIILGVILYKLLVSRYVTPR